jgi:pathogenesis-related protein 1
MKSFVLFLGLFLPVVSFSNEEHVFVPLDGFTLQVEPQTPVQQWLDAHNEARAKKGLCPLSWDERVAASAKNRAKQLTKSCRALRERNSGYGENLAMVQGEEFDPAKAVAMWMEEGQFYNPDNPKWCTGGKCRRYTQLMWSSTKYLGCATVKCVVPRGKHKDQVRIISVCRYDPKGNFRGRKPY